MLTDLAEGQVVQLTGLTDKVALSELLWDDIVWDASEVSNLSASSSDGRIGVVFGYDSKNRKHLVQTFDALRLAVPTENLRLYEPPLPGADEPGFHAVWPDSNAEQVAHFVAQVAETLATSDYCVVQLTAGDATCARALEESAEIGFRSLQQELDIAYFGRVGGCKAAFLDQLAEEKEQPTGGLDDFDLTLSHLTKLLFPVAPTALEFEPYSRTHGMVRMPFQNSQEEGALKPHEIDEDDISDGVLDEHVQFLKRRRLCMFLVCSSEGGDFSLFPRDEGKDGARFRITQGQLVLFRHDRMTYSYEPKSIKDVVLQSWILAEPDSLQNLNVRSTNQAMKDEIIGLVTGPKTPAGLQIDCVGMAVMFPGGGDGIDLSFWAICSTGTDGVIKIPLARFDMDLYSMDAETWTPGSTYTVHGGMIHSDVYALDNKFFNIPEEEVYLMAPSQRCLLEKGYEAMYRAGLRKQTLNGRRVGLFCGHSGDDWCSLPVFTYGTTGELSDKDISGYNGRIWSTITGRLAHCMGLKGPQQIIDTACSSALCAYGMGHAVLRKEEIYQTSVGINASLTEALMMGANMIPGPGNYINLCGPHMLSMAGRCFTFDTSADGFERGEGVGAFFTRVQNERTDETIATTIGACLNQDGRSASMTAPNGPSQQECIRGSMKEAGLSACEVTCAELHGTGTALGDPIEVGSLKGVMKDRVIPLLQTSAKTHIGHLEASAGAAGIMKCMQMCSTCAGSPNCHLISLNPHLDVTDYPVQFQTELTDFGANSGYSGVSSFGFGGANARADVFASAKRGPNATSPHNLDLEKLDYITVTCPIDLGPMHYLDGKAVPLASSVKYQRGPYHVDGLRDEFSAYDHSSSHYNGKWLIYPRDEDLDEVPEDPIYITGSWDCFTEPQEMVAGDYDGSFTVYVELGQTRCEKFQLQVDKDPERSIFPVAPDGTMQTRVVGPDAPGDGLYWLLDGRDDCVPAGTVYKITLQWGERPSMSWEIAPESTKTSWAESFRHTYQVAGSWNSWQFEPLVDASTKDRPNEWQTKFRVGPSGMEGFWFVRDYDEDQCIYPASDGGRKSVQACGPDGHRNDKRWFISGNVGDIVTLRLNVSDGHVEVAASAHYRDLLVAHSIEGPMRHSYWVSGTFNDGRAVQMDHDSSAPGVYRLRGTIGPSLREAFSVQLDGDPGLVLYPETSGSYPGESIVRGPATIDEDKPFNIFALVVGAEFEVVVDIHAVDRRNVVTVRWISERFDFASMKEEAYHWVTDSGMAA